MATAIKITAVLLVASLSSQFIDANCLSAIEGLFCSPNGKNYGTLAEHLYKATQSTELADNTKAAESLAGVRPNGKEHLIELAIAFSSLKGDQSDPESMCSKDNLANMRLVAGAMRDGGNLGPKKITEPILRLNSIVVKFITHAQPICTSYLDNKWPKQWKPSFTNEQMKFYVEQLWRVPISLSYKEYLGKSNNPIFNRYDWGSGLSSALKKDAGNDMYAQRKLAPHCRDPMKTTDKTILALQLQEYVYKPCREFITFDEAHDILEPYNDLFMSYFLIHKNMRKYFSNQMVPYIYSEYDYENYDKAVRDIARGYSACQRLLAMPEKDVLHQVRESRKQDIKFVGA